MDERNQRSRGVYPSRGILRDSLKEFIRPGGKNEIAFDQTVDLVGPDLQDHLPPGQVDIRVMTLFLRHLADALDELETVTEILEII